MQILHIRKDKGNREKKGLVASWPPRPAPIAALDSVGRFESVQTTVVVLTKYYGATLPKKTRNFQMGMVLFLVQISARLSPVLF